MKRWLLSILVFLVVVTPLEAAGPFYLVGLHITSQTTTALQAAAASKTVSIISGSLCVDGNGATTGLTIQDTAGTNLFGTNVVYVLNAGQCLIWPRSGQPYQVTTAGLGLQVVTTLGNGPVEVYLELVQQ